MIFQKERSQSEGMAEKTVEPIVIGQITSYIKVNSACTLRCVHVLCILLQQKPLKRSSKILAPEEYINFEVTMSVPMCALNLKFQCCLLDVGIL